LVNGSDGWTDFGGWRERANVARAAGANKTRVLFCRAEKYRDSRMQTASVALLLKRVSFALIALGFACSLLSLLHIAPKGDRFAALWLGLSGRRQDYTKTGWRLVQSGQVLCVETGR